MVVRQPVFDRNRIPVGFELRYRESEVGSDALARVLLSPAFDALRIGLPTYLRCTRRQLQDRVLHAADPRSIVLFVPSDLEITPDTINAVAELHGVGMKIGIDDFPSTPAARNPLVQLLPLTKFVRFDSRCQDPAQLALVAPALRQRGQMLVADHVADATVREQYLGLGFERFLGPHFSRGTGLTISEVPVNSTAAVWLHTLARQESTPQRELARALRSDPGLVYLLLRMAGPRRGGARPIASIGQALDEVGGDGLARWLALTTLHRSHGDAEPNAELLGKSVFRAHFCEALALPVTGHDRGTLYLVGLLSLADMLFRIPLSDLVERVGLSDDVRSALLHREGPYADALHVVEAYELGLWEDAADAAERLGIGANYLPSLYSQALRWAAEYLPARQSRSHLSLAS